MASAPDQVLRFVNAHRPAGGSQVVSGRGDNPEFQFVGFGWPPRPGVLGNRWLLGEVVGLSDGSTGVRADAQVVWIMPRAASERVPAGVRTIDITRGVPQDAPTLSLHVTGRANIRKIIAMINQLPAAQPGAWSCPAELLGVPAVTFRFLARSDG
ncbi:MAG TPA: hypothetical protein VIX82_02555, partial [Solirubrobacteraceae bacterium]